MRDSCHSFPCSVIACVSPAWEAVMMLPQPHNSPPLIKINSSYTRLHSACIHQVSLI